MNKEYLEALERLAMPDDLHIKECEKLGINPTQDYEVIKQALLELKAIKEAEPSKALELVYLIKDYFQNMIPYQDWINDIEKYVLKVQEQEKFIDSKLSFKDGSIACGFDYKGEHIVAVPLNEYDRLMEQEKTIKIINEKGVDVGYLKTCKTLEEYNSNCWNDEEDFNKRLTQEEFDLLKEMIK